MTFDPLEPEVGRGGVPRDRWDRALLKPRGINARAPYTAASSLADYVSNMRGIYTWEKRYLARGLGIRPDLAILAGAETYNTSFEDIDHDTVENKASGRRLDEIITRAMDAVQIHQKADLGTAGHALTEPGAEARGAFVPDVLRSEVDAWWRAMRGLRIVATEVFTACDALAAAGTFDHLVDGTGIPPSMTLGVDCTGTLIVVDKKFGKLKLAPFEVQAAVYANGEVYGTGDELDQRWTFEEKYGMPVNTQVGLIAHIPFGEAEAKLYPIDLREGWRGAQLAVEVRGWQRKGGTFNKPLDANELARRAAEALLADITTAEEASAIWRQFEDVWTERLTEVARAHLQGH